MLPRWPPQLSAQDESDVVAQAADWALSHSLVMRPNPPDLTSAIHGPFALYPTPFPRSAFLQAQSLQLAYNDLYANLAADEHFLDEVIGQTVAKVDDFQRGLWDIWQTVRREGIAQPLALGLFRSDYLLHGVNMAPKQVEFNTIASSFGPLASRVSELHRYLVQSGAYPSPVPPELRLDALPENGADVGLAEGLASAHQAYGNKE
jgi:hypothetical protein